MNTKTALFILKTHNRWRRGEDSEPQLNPSDIGKAIDVAIEVMEGENSNKQIEEYVEHCILCRENGLPMLDFYSYKKHINNN